MSSHEMLQPSKAGIQSDCNNDAPGNQGDERTQDQPASGDQQNGQTNVNRLFECFLGIDLFVRRSFNPHHRILQWRRMPTIRLLKLSPTVDPDQDPIVGPTIWVPQLGNSLVVRQRLKKSDPYGKKTCFSAEESTGIRAGIGKKLQI